MIPCAFFSPRLYPVLDRGKGHEDAVVSPQVPAGWPVGQAVFDHQAHRHLDHTMRIMAAWQGQIGQIDVEVLMTFRTVVVRVRDQEVNRTTRVQIPKVVQRTLPVFVAIRPMATFGAGLSLVVIAEQHDRGRREVLDVGDTFGGIWHILAWSKHPLLSWAEGLGPVVEKSTPCFVYTDLRIPATVSYFSYPQREFSVVLPGAKHMT